MSRVADMTERNLVGLVYNPEIGDAANVVAPQIQ